MALASRTRWTVCRYWADRLGVSSDAFENSGIAVGPAHEGGIQLFRRGEKVVIGAPELHVEQLQQRFDELATLELGNSDAIRKWLTDIDVVKRVIGPTFYGYTDRETFTPVESNARALTVDDESAYNAFQAAIPDDEWERGGTGFVAGETVGRFVDNKLVSLAGYERWDDLIAHVSVVTHPEYRDEGHGRAVDRKSVV